MKNILLILTGGTIGSVEHNGVIATNGTGCRILELYRAAHPEKEVCFTVTSPYTVLSENLNVGHWETLIHFILSADLRQYDGIIITHGSDTLTYSSAMLGLCLHGLGIPVVITASDYVPDHPKSNALTNFSAAVSLIDRYRDGVYTVYQNRNDDVRIFIPTRMINDRLQDLFLSADRLNALVSPEKLSERKNPYDFRNISFSKKVLLLHPYPSVDYEAVPLTEKTGAVMLVTYHSGTVSQDAENLLNRCQEQGIPLYLCSLKRKAAALYETSHTLLQKGAVPLYDITTESAYAKLLIGINYFSESLLEWMQKDIYFEMIP